MILQYTLPVLVSKRGLPLLFIRFMPYACFTFSEAVDHSRFETLLSSLFPFLWFTWGLSSGFGMKVIATSLCTKKDFVLPLQDSRAVLYPERSIRCLSTSVLLLALIHLISPFCEITYMPSYPGIGFHIQILC